MKKVIKEYNVYKFEELNKKIQEQLIEKEMQQQQEMFCEHYLKGEMEYKAKQLLKDFFGEKAHFLKIYYDLNYCQGSGAMIEFSLLYYKYEFKIKQVGRYCHEYSFIIEPKDYNKTITEKQMQKLKQKIVNMNGELSRFGYELIDIENFRSLAEEEFALDDREFLVNGEEI